MSDRRNFLKNLFGITAGSFIAAKAGSEIWQGRDEFENQYDKPEVIKEKITTYPLGGIETGCIVCSAWEPSDGPPPPFKN